MEVKCGGAAVRGGKISPAASLPSMRARRTRMKTMTPEKGAPKASTLST